jgi:hypothetical protein
MGLKKLLKNVYVLTQELYNTHIVYFNDYFLSIFILKIQFLNSLTIFLKKPFVETPGKRMNMMLLQRENFKEKCFFRFIILIVDTFKKCFLKIHFLP